MTRDKFIRALADFAIQYGYVVALVPDQDDPNLVGAFVVGGTELVEQLTVDFLEVDYISPTSPTGSDSN